MENQWAYQWAQDEEFTDCLREYMVFGEAFYTAMTFKEFCTIKHPEWYEPQLAADEESFKSIGKKLNEREGQVDWLEAHASSHVEDVCNEDDKPTFLDTPLEPSYEVVNTSTHDGDVDSTQDEVFQSAGVDSAPYPIYDTYDDEGVIAPEHDKFWGWMSFLWMLIYRLRSCA
jgi:hypothetical protein